MSEGRVEVMWSYETGMFGVLRSRICFGGIVLGLRERSEREMDSCASECVWLGGGKRGRVSGRRLTISEDGLVVWFDHG